MASGGSGKKEESALKTVADTKAAEAEKVDPLEEEVRRNVTAMNDWKTGKSGPLDIRAMPDQTGMALYADSKRVTDARRVGRGVNSMGEGANPNHVAALDREFELERGERASAMLEGFVEDKVGDLDTKMMGLAARSDSRRGAAADRAAQAYQSFLQRPKQPSFMKSLATSLVGGLSMGSKGWAV